MSLWSYLWWTRIYFTRNTRWYQRIKKKNEEPKEIKISEESMKIKISEEPKEIKISEESIKIKISEEPKEIKISEESIETKSPENL